MRIKAQSLLPGLDLQKAQAAYGGELSTGKRKAARPLDPKQALHVVMRSSQARGAQSMLDPRHCARIHDFTHRLAKRWGIRVYRYANVGNHLHLLIRIPSRAAWRRFSRELAGGIAQRVTGARKGLGLAANRSGRGFWDHLIFTRIVRFGRDFRGVGQYVIKNLFEVAGVPMKKLLAEGYQIISISNPEVRIRSR